MRMCILGSLRTIIIVLGAHAVEGVDEMVIVLCIAEDLLMIFESLR